MQRHLQNQKGFTLIEILVTLAIMTIVLIPLSNMMVTSFRINAQSRDQLEANNIAQLYMENWKADNLLDLLDDSQLESLNLGSVVQLPDSSYNGFTIETKVASQLDYESMEGASHASDLVIKLNETEGKATFYNESDTKLGMEDLQSTYQVNIKNTMSTKEIEVAGYTVQTNPSEEPVVQVICEKPANVLFNVVNQGDQDAVFYVVKTPLADAAVIDVLAQQGKLRSYTSTAKLSKNNLYSIEITVNKHGKAITSLKGLKTIEFK